MKEFRVTSLLALLDTVCGEQLDIGISFNYLETF